MNCIQLLKRIGLLSYFSSDDIALAESENIIREHDKAIERVTATAEQVGVSSQRLRESIHRSRTKSFGELERSMQRAGGRRSHG
jgi:hypothetical protein